MATQTPNLGLTLPVGTENVSRTVINGNNTLIDTFAGNVNTAMDQMGSNLGILETGDTATHAIAKGEYVTWKGASYTADAAISIGETLAATGGSKNLTACDKGIANALNSKMTPFPDYSNKLSTPTGVSINAPYTMQKDGYIIALRTSNVKVHLTINNNAVSVVDDCDAGYFHFFAGFVKAGDVIATNGGGQFVINIFEC